MSKRAQPDDDTPVLITEAEPSHDDQQAARRRKYALMMSLRIPCLVLAAAVYPVWWLSLIILAVSIPLPWMAVLIANDRTPLRKERVNRYERPRRGIESGGERVVENPAPSNPAEDS